MSSFRTWMLPEGVVEALPTEAEKLNALTQTALTTFARWGYQPLRPPMMEYADTFVGSGRNDNLVEQTIQFKDQKSGKQLGFRADITPQIARIDAHYLKTDQVARYAYAGEVVRSYPTGHGSARNPTIIGAELLGSSSQQADTEIVSLLITFLNQLELPNLTIELGNVDIIVELLKEAGIEEEQFSQFFESLACKDKERLLKLSERNRLNPALTKLLGAMTQLYGDVSVLAEAQALFADYTNVLAEISRLGTIATALSQQHTTVNFHIDLADVHGYGYHNGLIFSAYVNNVWKAVARGGRYDSFGNDFGEDEHMRPSTGFSCDLSLLSPLLLPAEQMGRIILCQVTDSLPELAQFIANLRANGDTVIQQFSDDIAPNRDFTHQLLQTKSGFVVTQK